MYVIDHDHHALAAMTGGSSTAFPCGPGFFLPPPATPGPLVPPLSAPDPAPATPTFLPSVPNPLNARIGSIGTASPIPIGPDIDAGSFALFFFLTAFAAAPGLGT